MLHVVVQWNGETIGGNIMWPNLGPGTEWTLSLTLALLFYIAVIVLALDDAVAGREAQSTRGESFTSRWLVTPASHGLAIWPQLDEDAVMSQESGPRARVSARGWE
jgi:hypothetical protein